MVNMILDICQAIAVLLGFSGCYIDFESLSFKSVTEAVVRLPGMSLT